MRLLLSNNKQVENSVYKDEMETWGNQQSAVQTGGKATPANSLSNVRSQAKDSRKAKVEQSEFKEELSEQESRLSL
jgi:hypothetical protein